MEQGVEGPVCLAPVPRDQTTKETIGKGEIRAVVTEYFEDSSQCNLRFSK